MWQGVRTAQLLVQARGVVMYAKSSALPRLRLLAPSATASAAAATASTSASVITNY